MMNGDNNIFESEKFSNDEPLFIGYQCTQSEEKKTREFEGFIPMETQ